MKNLLTLVVAVALCSTMGFAQGLGLKGVGGSVGYMSASVTTGGTSSTSESLGGFAIGAHVDLGEFTPGFQLIPELQYWTASKDFSIPTGFGTTVNQTIKFSDFAINGNVHYNIAMEGSVKPYVGAGLGLNFVSSSADVPHYGTVSSSETKFGVNIMGGANFAMGNMTITPEVRYVLASDVNHMLLKVGVMVPLGK